jgi:hypothetical protein
MSRQFKMEDRWLAVDDRQRLLDRRKFLLSCHGFKEETRKQNLAVTLFQDKKSLVSNTEE